MPFAVTHVLVPIIILDTLRDRFEIIKNFKLTNRFIFLSGIAGLLPDLDLPLFSILDLFGIKIASNIGHRIFFHNIWIPISFFGFFLVYYALKRIKAAKVFLILTFGFSIHLILDGMIVGSIMPLFPLSTTEVGLDLVRLLPISRATTMVSLDAILLLLWLWHEEIGHKIKDYF